MTSSDRTVLPPGALDAVGARVGVSLVGDPDAARAELGVVCGQFNGGITVRLLDGVLTAAARHGIAPDSITTVWVPGAFELPLAAQHLAEAGTVDAVIALGAVIRGDTPHFDYVAGQCAAGLQRVALDTGLPVAFGVLTTDTVEQALERCGGDDTNKGFEAAVTVLAMVDVLGRIPGTEQ